MRDVIAFLEGDGELPGPEDLPADGGPGEDGDPAPDLSDVYGQKRVKRALEVAAAGGHNVLTRCL